MVSLYKDPHGEKIFSNISPRENMKTSAGRSTSGTDDNTELGALSTTEHWFTPYPPRVQYSLGSTHFAGFLYWDIYSRINYRCSLHLLLEIAHFAGFLYWDIYSRINYRCSLHLLLEIAHFAGFLYWDIYSRINYRCSLHLLLEIAHFAGFLYWDIYSRINYRCSLHLLLEIASSS